MKHYSSETMRLHEQDLTKELKVKQTPDALRYFIINYGKGKPTFVMYDMAHRQSRDWPATGVLDLHDVSQECYCALIRAYNKVDWEIINTSNNPGGSLWAYLKKSIKFDVRKAINTFKDGMNVPLNKIWEVKTNKFQFDLDNFFSLPFDSQWMFKLDEAYGLLNEAPISKWETEILYEGLQDVMRKKLSSLDRQILEMLFGIDQKNNKPRTYKYVANKFNTNEANIRKMKQRALDKLKNEEVQEYLTNYYDF